MVVVALILVVVLCAFAQHQSRIEEQLHSTLPGEDDLYYSWYVNPDGALLYTPKESQTLIVSMDDEKSGETETRI